MVDYWISQAAVVIAMICLGSSYLIKNKKTILLLGIIYAAFYGLQYLLIGAYTGFAMNCVSIIRTVWWFFLSKYNKDNKWYNLVIIVALIIFVGALTYTSWFSIVSLLSTILFTYSIWQKNISVYRWLSLPISVCFITYAVLYNSIFGIILESVLLVVEIVGIIIYYRKKKKEVAQPATNLSNIKNVFFKKIKVSINYFHILILF